MLKTTVKTLKASCLRIMNNISRRDHVSNLTLLESINETPLSGLVQARQLRWLSHQLRRPTSDLVQQFCLWEPSQEKQRPGGKRTTYREYIASVFRKNTHQLRLRCDGLQESGWTGGAAWPPVVAHDNQANQERDSKWCDSIFLTNSGHLQIYEKLLT